MQKKILILSSFSYPDFAGSGVHAFRLARYINRHSGKAVVLTLNRGNRLPRKELVEGIPIYRIPYRNRNGFTKLLAGPRILWNYFLHLRRHDLLLIYGGKTYGYQAALLLARLLSKPVVFRSLLLDVDDLQSLCEGSSVKHRINRQCFKYVTRYYAINNSISERYVRCNYPPNRLLLLPQGVDLDTFCPLPETRRRRLRERLGIPADHLLLLSVGFVLQRKGYEELFRALSPLRQPFTYVVVGEFDFGPSHFLYDFHQEALLLVEKGKKLLGNRVQFRGGSHQVAAYMQAANIFLHNASDEVPNVVYEAMACALPVIARQNVRVNFLHSGTNCLLVQTTKDLTQALNLLIENPEQAGQMGEEARQTVIREAGFGKIYAALLDVANGKP